MKIHRLTGPPDPWLGEALEEFEKQFQYPLGKGTSFRVSHGSEYVPFFQAMGDAITLVAESRGRVLGSLTGIRRGLRFPDGTVRDVACLCDFKVRPNLSAGRVMQTLAQVLQEEISGAVGGRGYGVVMDGTRRVPSTYTGIAALPQFSVVAEVTLLKISTRGTVPPDLSGDAVTLEQVRHLHEAMGGSAYVTVGSHPSIRSVITPTPLCVRTAVVEAVGLVEDTRRGKRLILHTGEEMLAAHLSHFSYTTPTAGAALIAQGLAVATAAGFPDLFVSVPRADAEEICELLKPVPVVRAPATVFACGLAAGIPWKICSSEV